MPIQNNQKNKIVFINGVLVDLSSIDRQDLDIILSSNGKIPLSSDERKFLEYMHERLKLSTRAIEKLTKIILESKLIDTEETDLILAEMHEITEESYNVLALSIDNIGKGFSIIKSKDADE